MATSMNRWVGIVCLVAAAAIMIFVVVRRDGQPGQSGKGEFDVPIEERSVVLITVDTTRADRLTPYGADNVETPALQRLADHGVLFENAYSVAPITLVAHTSMLTGLYPFDHGVRNNGIQRVSDDAVTMAEILRDRGYRTGAFVSAAVLERQYGLDQGFEVYDDDLSTGRDRRPRMVADRPAEAVFASAAQWLESLEPDETFFLWVHLYDPHASYSPPAPFRDQYRNTPYEGEIAYMDSEIGKFLRHPRVGRTGEGAPIVTVIGDHGESLGEHGEQTHALLAYDSTLHIPWILYVPGGPAALRLPQQVSQVDLAPTLLELVGESSPKGIHGRSLLPLISGGSQFEKRGLYSETYLPYYTYGWAKLRVLRAGPWKYIDAPTPELYEVRRDPRELTNVHERQPGPAHDMSRDLEEMLAGVEDAEKETSMELDAESIEQLRSLGYLAVSSQPVQDGERPDPKDVVEVHVLLEKTRALLTDRFFEEAERAVREVLQIDPSNLAGLIELVNALEGQQRLDEAAIAAEKVLELDPDYARGYIVLSRIESARGRYEEAVELSRLAVERDSTHPDYMLVHASLLQRAGRPQESLDTLNQALEQFPDHPYVNTIYARLVELPQGRLESAEQRLREAVERDPFLASAWLEFGRVLEATDRHAEAAEAYREGLNRSSDDASLHRNLGKVLARRGDFSTAEQHLREALRLTPRFDADIYVNLGVALAEMRRYREARRLYSQVLERLPDHPGARNNLAISLYREGRAEKAREVLEALVEDVPGFADAHNNLAGFAVDHGRWRMAELHSRRALELEPDLVAAHNNLAIALEEQGDAAGAERGYEKALELDAEYFPALINLGILLRKTDRPQAAVDAFQKVLERLPNQAIAHLEMAEVYARSLGDSERARKHLNAYLRLAPDEDPRRARASELLTELGGA